jgi:hypothetical protein
MKNASQTYKWKVLDTDQVIQLEYKPDEGNELKVHTVSHPDLGVFAAIYLKEDQE